MKHSKLHRLLACVMVVVMLAGLLPALSLTAGARAPLVRNVATADELRQYLEASEDYDLILTKDIDKYVDNVEVWCTVRGNKRLDMHGYDLCVHQDHGKDVSYLFKVSDGADLTVYDSVNQEYQSTIEYHAYIHGGTLGMLTYYRHLFDVYGSLTLNNIKCVAGRVKTEYNTWYRKTVHKQIYGSAVIVHGGGYLEVNGAYFSGHPHPERTYNTPVILAGSGSTVIFNAGEVHGLGRAQCFRVDGGADVRVAYGIFDSDYYKYVQWGMPDDDVGKADSPGIVGLTAQCLAPDALTVYDGDALDKTSDLVVYSPTYALSIEGASGDSHVTDGVTHYRLLDSNPVLKVTPFYPYFKTLRSDSPQGEHILDTTWRIFDGFKQIGESSTRGTTVASFNLKKDIPNFTPEADKAYRITCEICEIVGPKAVDVKCFRYSGDYYALVTDTLEAPGIRQAPLASQTYSPGGSVSISIEAEGDNVTYQWYRSHAGGRPYALTGRSATTSRLTLFDLTAEYDGDYFFCIVSNSQGRVQSSSCRLVMNKPITEFPLLVDPPMHGVPLDTSVELDIPGLEVTNVRWAYRTLKATYETLSEARCSNPIAGQYIYLCVSIRNDGSADVASGAKAPALGVESTSAEFLSAYEGEFRIPLTVGAEGNVKIDTVQLSFDSDGAPEVGQQVGSVLKRSCGYRAWAPGIRDADIRYSIDEVEWLADGLSVENPTVEQNHTYTLKVRLAASDDWIFSKNTVVLLDGEEVKYEYTNENMMYYITFQKTYAMMENPFEDVTETDYFFAPVLWAYNHEPQVTTGTSASRFSPGKTCTRAQVVTFLWRANGCPAPNTTVTPFVEVRPGQYYYDAVLWAVENGVTNGVDATHFGPDRGCTRGQVVTFLWRSAGEPEPLNDSNPFIDVPAGQYYYNSVLWAVGNRITTGTSANKFSPDSTCTRGQIVTFLYRAIAQKNMLQKDDFFMYLEDVFDFDDAGFVVTGLVGNGTLHTGDTIRILTREDGSIPGKEFRVTVDKIEQSKRIIPEAKKGDNIGVTISGDFDKTLLKTDDALVGADVPMTPVSQSVTGTLRLLTKEEGGRHTPISDGYRPEIGVARNKCIATVGGLPEGTLDPGETAYVVELSNFSARPVVYPGQRLTLLEGGKRVGEFIVGEIH